MEAKMMNFDKPKLEQFKKAYQKAIDDNKEVFEFDGHPVLVAYAKYVIEYLNNEMSYDIQKS